MRSDLNDAQSLLRHVASQVKHIAAQQSVTVAKIALRDYLRKHPELCSHFDPVLCHWRPIPFSVALDRIIFRK